MANPNDKTERQQLEKERAAMLACLAICEAALVKVNQASASLTKKTQKGISEGDGKVVSTLSELIRASSGRQTRQPQTDTPCSTSKEVDRDTANPSQSASLAHRQRESQPQTQKPSRMEDHRENYGNSTRGLQRDSHKESFVVVDDSDLE